MATAKSIGAIELSSVGIGYQVEDEMLKAASVDLLIARTICSGKYLIVVGGSVSDVQAAVQAGLEIADEAIIDHLVIPNVEASVFPALGQSVSLGADHAGALGVVETVSGVSVLAAADAAAKAARVTLFRRRSPQARPAGLRGRHPPPGPRAVRRLPLKAPAPSVFRSVGCFKSDTRVGDREVLCHVLAIGRLDRAHPFAFSRQLFENPLALLGGGCRGQL